MIIPRRYGAVISPIRRAERLFCAAAREDLPPDAQWLRDNARALYAQASEAQRDARWLRKKAFARLRGFCTDYVSSCGSALDERTIVRKLKQAQASTPFTVRELRQLQPALRCELFHRLLALLPNIQQNYLDFRTGDALAAAWERGAVKAIPQSPVVRYRALEQLSQRGDVQAVRAFRARLRADNHALPDARQAREQLLHAAEKTGALIGMILSLPRINWARIFEKSCAACALLRQDATYRRMADDSRALYLTHVSRLARQMHTSETTLCQAALALAKAHDNIEGEVGYYLLEQPMLLCAALKKTSPLTLRMQRHSAVIYLLYLLISAAAFAVLGALCLPACAVPFFVLSLTALSHRLAQRLSARLFAPRVLPRIKRACFPKELRVLVALPVVLLSPKHTLQMCRRLSVLHLANANLPLDFMLVSDFTDAQSPQDEGDDTILRALQNGMRALNDTYGPRFYALHRARSRSRQEGCYIGRERKRGALEMLNCILCGESYPDTLAYASTPPDALRGRYAYVITLDADSLLPAGAAERLIGAMLHPLQRGRTGILQPRMQTLPMHVATHAQELLGGMNGLDGYNAAAQDFYQDVFARGSFMGKGIYDPKIMLYISQSLPENAILSHDLLEGELCHTQLMTDTLCCDGHPAKVSGFLQRAHRWTRGDWQLLPFLRDRRLDLLSRLKMLDNLRRSILPAARMTALILCAARGAWLPFLLLLLPLRSGGDVAALALLPVMALNHLDAVFRALWRMLISGKKRLQWATAAQVEQHDLHALGRYFFAMLPGGLLLFAAAGPVFWPGFALGVVWLAQPLIMRWLDRPRTPQMRWSAAQQHALYAIARDTFAFFTQSTTARTHHLPPDNVQLSPPRGADMRTSPTNIGMYLLSLCAARELGLLDAQAFFSRLHDTLQTLEHLRTWHGIFYNWYDLNTLRPMPDAFVSSVDAGNLALALTVCAQCARMQLSQAQPGHQNVPVRLDALRNRMQLHRLYDAKAHLFYIGYDAAHARMSDGHYDLFASESLLLSFAAISGGDVDARHWQHLGRIWTRLPQKAMLSWSGTLFEYLMSGLLLPAYPGTAYALSQRACVRCQLRHAQKGLWGISESGYAQFDQQLSYRYQAFGLPELALDNQTPSRVIAPYAAALALKCAPQAACDALLHMRALGCQDDQGFFEAADFTATHSPTLVYSHMAHHQGMILCAICNALRQDYFPRVLSSLPRAAAHLALLNEAPPRRVARLPRPLREHRDMQPVLPFHMRAQENVPPDMLVLSGGGSTLLACASGHNALLRGDICLTRFDSDCRAQDGVQFYACNADTRACLNLTQGAYTFTAGAAQSHLHADGLKSHLAMCIDPLTGAAVYHLRLRNTTDAQLHLLIAAYTEPALASQQEDRTHIAFSNLFIDVSQSGARELTAHRRALHGQDTRTLRFALLTEQPPCRMMNDRMLFMGAAGDDAPRGMLLNAQDFSLSKSADPCLALRSEITIEAGHEIALFYALGTQLPHDEAAAQRAFSLCNDHMQVYHRLLGMTAQQIMLACRVAERLLLTGWPRATLPSSGVRGLWRQGISGNWPILLITAQCETDCSTISQTAHLFAYLLENGVQAELVILLPAENEYDAPLRTFCERLLLRPALRALQSRTRVLANTDPACSQSLLALCALHIRADTPLQEQLSAPPKAPLLQRAPTGGQLPAMARLHQANGFGGFTEEGSYVVLPDMPRDGLAPWCHILCNDLFGTLVCEQGILYSSAGNSRMARVTAVCQDSVRITPSEEYFLREGAQGWSLTPAPYFNARMRVFFDMGTACYQTALPGMQCELLCLADCEAPAGLRILTLHNTGDACRQLQFSAAARFYMGEDGRGTHVFARQDTVYAQHPDMAGTAFFCLAQATAHTASTGLYGGPLRAIEAVSEGTVGILQRDFTLQPHQTVVFTVLLGCCEEAQISQVISLLSQPRARERAARAYWAERLQGLLLYLPDRQLSRYANGFLPYQIRAARLMLRAGFYQSGGAWGFRDQLQDMLSLLYTEPAQARTHILRCAARQYTQGDVQHWWHPNGAGVRTRISDDLLFLPYVTARYVSVTGDTDILHARAPFLHSAELAAHEHDRYETPEQTAETVSLMEHCLRAIGRVRYGEHGIPLMQGGDWNDGMDRVGGESAWLGFFMIVVLRDFAPLCQSDICDALNAQRMALQNAMQAAWTGKWFLRAWYQDGRTLGAPDSDVPRIDLITQCFACFAGMPHEQVLQALEHAWQALHRQDTGITLLLSPPFTPDEQAGYIGAYCSGMRENGGQYTHAVPWLMRALLQTGQLERAWQLLYECLPYTHAQTPAQAQHYRVEPYALAADIYDNGRGGWTWYTGSASWLFVVLLCDFLGFSKQGDRLRFCPRVPAEWPECTLVYRYGSSRYQLTAARDAPFITLDGEKTAQSYILLRDDGRTHEARFPLN